MNQVLLFTQLLIILLNLFIVGEPFRYLIARYSKLFSNLGLFRLLVINFYLGGLLIFGLALVPLGLFQTLTMYLVSFGSLVAVIFLHKTEISITVKKTMVALRSHPFRDFFSSPKLFNKPNIEGLFVLLFALLIYYFAVNSLSSFVLGSIHDT